MHIEERNFDELEAENPALRISPKHSEGGDKFLRFLKRKNSVLQLQSVANRESKTQSVVG